MPLVQASAIGSRCECGLALPGEAFGAHAVIENLVGAADSLSAHRLLLDLGRAAELPISAERGVDVLIDTALGGERRVSLRVAILQLANHRRVIGTRLYPANLRRWRGADREQQA